MKQIGAILIVILLISGCNKKIEKNPENESDLKEISIDEEYEKVSDTAYIKNGSQLTHRIIHLKNGNKNLILFKRISVQDNGEEEQSVLDTLSIKNLDSIFFITIGYCKMKTATPEEIIAIVEKTEKDTIQTIVKAWKANSHTRKIENIKNLNALTCLNEFYHGA